MQENDNLNTNEELEAYVYEKQDDVETLETVDVIEVSDVEKYNIDTFDAFPALGESNELLKHTLMTNRELPDQHPITAITGLREELDDIEALGVVYSNEKNQANYYLWEDGNPHNEDRIGHFVSVCGDTDDIKLCTKSDDIFGVTVLNAGFIGGQSNEERDYKYGLVVHNGLVAVQCETDVAVGDSVISNDYGCAQKADGGYGYKVFEIQFIYGITYAIIQLTVSINQVSNIMKEFDTFDERMRKAEANIVSAINVANNAHNQATKALEKSSTTDQNYKDNSDKISSIESDIDKLESNISSINQAASQAQTIANAAAASAESARQEAVVAANKAIADVKELTNALEPVTSWEYTDPDFGETYRGAEYLTNYIKNDVATKVEIQTAESRTDEAMSLISKNAKDISSFVFSIDKYSVGEYSQAYGLTQEQAFTILKDGMIYIPTTESHSEAYGELTQEFLREYYYTWNGTNWIESANPSVIFSSEMVESFMYYIYWYVDSDNDIEYNGKTYYKKSLYKWNYDTSEWEQVNILAGNVTNRIVSAVRQTTNEIAAEIVGARGDAASLKLKIDSQESRFSLLASRVNADDISYSVDSTIYESVDKLPPTGSANYYYIVGNGSPYSIYYWDGTSYKQNTNLTSDGVNLFKVNVASIIGSVNNDESSISLNANRINFNGTTFNLNTQSMVFTTGNLIMDKDGIRLYDTDSKLKINIGVIDSSNLVHGIDIYSGAFRLYGVDYSTQLTNDDAAIYFDDSGNMFLNGEVRKYLVDSYNTSLSTGYVVRDWKDELYIGEKSFKYWSTTSTLNYKGIFYFHDNPILNDGESLDSSVQYERTGCFFGLQNFDYESQKSLDARGILLAGFGNSLTIANRSEYTYVDYGGNTKYYNSSIDIVAEVSSRSNLDGKAYINLNSDGVTNNITISAEGSANSGSRISLLGNTIEHNGTVVSTSSVATTSDKNLKHSISALPSKYSELFDRLTPVIYKYNDGTSNRNHTGFIAQDVSTALDESGIDSQDFAGLVILNAGTENERWTLRYEEFIALNTYEIQKLKARVTELENKLATLING